MDGFIGEIRAVPYNFAPVNWFYCYGDVLNIQSYPALYAVIGTAFGGDGKTTFQLPNLKGLIPVCMGQGAGLSPVNRAQTFGASTQTLKAIPVHNHLLNVEWAKASKFPTYFTDTPSTASVPGVLYPTPVTTTVASNDVYYPSTAATSPVIPAYMSPNMLTSWGAAAGAALPIDNHQPYVAMNYVICYEGQFLPKPN